MPEPLRRRSIRLPGFDYTQPGVYFVTICTWKRCCLFGAVTGQVMSLNQWGKIAEECWQEIPIHFPRVWLDQAVVMPNHMHGIVCIQSNDEKDVVGAQHAAPLPNVIQRPIVASGSLGAIIRSYKSAVTRRIHPMGGRTYPIWQRNYYEHIIRTEEDFDSVREYIVLNPANWEKDNLFST